MERKVLGEQMRRAVGYSDKMGLAEARREAAKVYAEFSPAPIPCRSGARLGHGRPRSGGHGARQRAAQLSPKQLAEERGKHGYAPSGTTLRDVLDRFQVEFVPRVRRSRSAAGTNCARRSIIISGLGSRVTPPSSPTPMCAPYSPGASHRVGRSAASELPICGRILRRRGVEGCARQSFPAVDYDDLVGGSEAPRER